MTNRPGEFEIIEKYFARLAAPHAGSFGLRDDAALIECPPGRSLVVTSDALVEGVHFLTDDPAGQVAQKLLRVNLSDLAAMGAKPAAYTLTVALTADWSADWLAAFSAGLARDQALFGIVLVGGDTVSTPGPKMFSLTAFGEIENGRELRRNGAAAGDTLWVSGTIGDAALGLKILRGGLTDLAATDRDALVARFRSPEPRLALGQRLAGLAHAAIDISDGLAQDAGHLCRESQSGATIDIDAVPLSAAARRVLAGGAVPVDDLVVGGDDYELLFAADPGDDDRILAAAAEAGIAVAAIGRFEGNQGLRMVDGDGREIIMPRPGYQHF